MHLIFTISINNALFMTIIAERKSRLLLTAKLKNISPATNYKLYERKKQKVSDRLVKHL